MDIVDYSDRHRAAVEDLMALLQDHEAALDVTRPPGDAVAGRHFQYLLDCCAQQDGGVYVALDRGSVCGFLVVLVERVDADDQHLYEPFKSYGLVTDLLVAEAYRGRGVAGALMARAEAHVQSRGIGSIQVAALAANTDAAAFYRHAGYAPYEITYRKLLS